MSGSIEYGKCELCGDETYLIRTYFRYDIKCNCHSPQHFEIAHHCSNCIPKEPKETKININTETLKDLIKLSTRKTKLDKINNES